MSKLAEIERAAVLAARRTAVETALTQARGKVPEAAEALGITRPSLYKHVKTLRIDLAVLRASLGPEPTSAS